MYVEREEQEKIYRHVFILFVWKKFFLFFQTNKSLREKIVSTNLFCFLISKVSYGSVENKSSTSISIYIINFEKERS